MDSGQKEFFFYYPRTCRPSSIVQFTRSENSNHSGLATIDIADHCNSSINRSFLKKTLKTTYMLI